MATLDDRIQLVPVVADDVASDASAEAENKTDGNEAVQIPDVLSLLPLNETVVFPMVVSPLTVGKPSSVQLVDDAVVAGQRMLALALSKAPEKDQPSIDEVNRIGVAAVIHTMMRLPDGHRMIVQGVSRIRISEVVQESPYLKVRVEKLEDDIDFGAGDTNEIEALQRNLIDSFTKIVSMSPGMPEELLGITRIDHPSAMTDTMAAHLPIDASEKQSVLETVGVRARMLTLLKLLSKEAEVLQIGTEIATQISNEMGKGQREYYLREQLKAIQRELGQEDDQSQEIDELREAIEAAGMPEEAHAQATKELDRLSRMPVAAPEFGITRNYLDWMIQIPWAVASEDNLDIPRVHQILDQDHYGMDKVKERILEYLSVRKFKKEGIVRQPILCLSGPPGVGKTSLGMSIARALGKKFVRMSLGGIHDEAEIRGHRRTYIGALPGQIIQGIRRAGTNNPVFMLDEIDKVGRDFRGDPSSALLEVLDPEQNGTFRDNYLEVPFDLAKVLFITTANVLDTIPPPLRDRMEMIEIAGYTEEEKIQIAKRHLIPKQMEEHGLGKQMVKWRAGSLKTVISGYTREAGVRNLERQIAAICRKMTRAFAEGREEPFSVTSELVQELLGAPRFPERELAERLTIPGVATGLAYTPVGGDVLFVEATRMPGSKQLVLTGQLGDVMRESAQAALSYIRSHTDELKIEPDFFAHSDLHVHVPAGAIPKDGPSAGVVMSVAMASLLTGRKVQPKLAMTGEITLRGKVLPVGGIKEKVLAAHRAGVRTVILPTENQRDVEEDVPEEIRRDMRFVYVKTIREALDVALEAKSSRRR